jgi:hypothetical protein
VLEVGWLYIILKVEAKCAIQITNNHQEALNEVITVYGNIGLKQPLYSQYEELLRTQPDITHFISAGYFDIIQVHKVVLQVFTQRCKLLRLYVNNIFN